MRSISSSYRRCDARTATALEILGFLCGVTPLRTTSTPLAVAVSRSQMQDTHGSFVIGHRTKPPEAEVGRLPAGASPLYYL